MITLADKLRPYVEQIKADASAGNVKAKQVIDLYQMHASCPSDPGAPALCEAVFEDWKAKKK